MTRSISQFAHFLVRFAILWVADAISLAITAIILPGMEFVAVGTTPLWVVAVATAFVLGLVNLLIRPLILLIARPLGFIVMFVVGFFVNAIVLMITSNLLPGFELGSFFNAIVAGIVFAAVNSILTGIIEVDEEGSFYQNRIERVAKREPFKGSSEPGRGLVMLEIDGLSFHHIKKALADGLMPTLNEMIEEEGYTL